MDQKLPKDVEANLGREAAKKAAKYAESPEGKQKVVEKYRAEARAEYEKCRDSIVSRTEYVDEQGQIHRRIMNAIDGSTCPPGAVTMTNHASRKERLGKIREFIFVLDGILEFLRLKQSDRLPVDLEGYLAKMYAAIPNRNVMVIIEKPKQK